MEDDECLAEFRVKKRIAPALVEALQIPDWISCNQRGKAEGTEALCMLLKRFTYPCRCSDMVPRFAHPVPVFSIVNNEVLVCKRMPKLFPKVGRHCRIAMVLSTERLGLLRGLITIRELSTTAIQECML